MSAGVEGLVARGGLEDVGMDLRWWGRERGGVENLRENEGG